MKIRYLMMLAVGLTFVKTSSFASTYFTDAFNVNPTLSATQAPGVWYTDRYAPAAFDSQPFLGDNRLHIGISSNDGFGANATGGGRPGAYTSTFYNTQGRNYDLGNGYYTSIKAKLYVAADWATTHRRSDIWGVAADGSNAVTAYPIIGLANTTGSAIVCRVWDDEIGWVDVSALVPGGITTSRWYNLEIQIKPGVFQFFVDGKEVYADDVINGSVQLKSVIMQAYNFNDPTLPVVNQAFQESYDVYWDDFTAGPIPLQGYPVDLNGTYRAANGGPLDHTTPTRDHSGLAIAATFPIDFGGGSVFERSGVNTNPENAVNGSFTPFNDVTKKPKPLVIPSVDGTSTEADVSLSGTWKPFQWGGGPGVPFATGDEFGLAWSNTANTFGVQIVTDLANQYVARLFRVNPVGSLGILDASQHTFPVGTTSVRVNTSLSGGILSATVMPLDGPDAYVVSSLGSTDGTTLTGTGAGLFNSTSCGFLAGFETMEHVAAAANATISNYTTDAVTNSMFLFADDPYVLSAQSIGYRVGQANLLQTVTGFQAFMNATAGQTFTSGTYAGPYSTFNPVTITALGNAAAASASYNQANLTVVNLLFGADGAEAAVSTGFRPNTGTEENKFAGGPPTYSDVFANTSDSNTVVIDNTAPVLTAPVLGGSSWISPNAVVGTLTITADATDLGAQQSGLDGRPAGMITWSNLSVTPISTVSLIGNTFRATLPITASTPNGSATLYLQVCDRAGNCSVQTLVFNVSTVNVALTIQERGVTANVTRVVRIVVGGSVGVGTDAITVRKEVNFFTPVVILGDTSREGTTLVTYQDLDLGDDGFANNSVPSNADLTLVYVKDPFFSLGKQEPLAGSVGNLTSTVTLRMGDVTDNNIVNVSDLAVWAANNGSSQNPNTSLLTPTTPRQANVDGAGTVDLGDRNLIISIWLMAGDALPGDFGNYRPGPGDGSLTVSEVIEETGLSKTLVFSMDLNGDGRLTRQEVLRWSRGGDKG